MGRAIKQNRPRGASPRAAGNEASWSTIILTDDEDVVAYDRDDLREENFVLGTRLRARSVRRFLCDTSGATAIEYVLIAGLIFLALSVSLSVYGGSTGSLYANFSAKVVDVLSRP
ncbi:Flp family type IVb pilin [Methylobacterium sp. ID0610]|uniref:Flp family type IVb pilin n=1 Tax=Methylobacterium carpenticola TaxID=3344827 RepID=UPI0036BA5281